MAQREDSWQVTACNGNRKCRLEVAWSSLSRAESNSGKSEQKEAPPRKLGVWEWTYVTEKNEFLMEENSLLKTLPSVVEPDVTSVEG